jgi:hypothetical protein
MSRGSERWRGAPVVSAFSLIRWLRLLDYFFSFSLFTSELDYFVSIEKKKKGLWTANTREEGCSSISWAPRESSFWECA